MKSFKQFINDEKLTEQIELFEHEIYKNIPGTKNSYRPDSGNTNTMTTTHSHIYAKPKGRGRELYSVDINGKGHDGYSGAKIPDKHANYFRSKGYDISNKKVLEKILLIDLHYNSYKLLIINE